MDLLKSLNKEIKRAEELLGMYQEIGSSGLFSNLMIKHMIKHDLEKARKAIKDGNVVNMLASYKELKILE